MIARTQFLEAVESLVGTPVVHGGRVAGPRGGVDCVGVPIVALALCGAAVVVDAIYNRLPGEDQLAAGLSRYCDRVAVAVPGDLLQVHHGRQARHVMVLVDELNVVHAWGKGGVVRNVPLVGQVAQAWRIRGIT